MSDQTEVFAAVGSVPRLMNVEPILAVPDVPAATRYYKDVLDFQGVWHWGDPVVHGGANRDGIQIQFEQEPGLAAHSEGRSLWIRVQDVASLYATHLARQAEIVSELETKPWNVTEYTVRDLNGYRLRFAGNVGRPGLSESMPAGVRIEQRIPSWPEMRALVLAVGWADESSADKAPRVLSSAVCGVVAITDDRTVGCAFLSTDGCGFCYIRDVIVHPDWQRKHIGTALMRALMERMRDLAPGDSLAGLFTGENLDGFYSQFGFRGPSHGLYGMTMDIK
jgi:GNAT superfamily N-acetyltransferase/uncharacterized glyoxalase superfamily protein PhnB